MNFKTLLQTKRIRNLVLTSLLAFGMIFSCLFLFPSLFLSLLFGILFLNFMPYWHRVEGFLISFCIALFLLALFFASLRSYSQAGIKNSTSITKALLLVWLYPLLLFCVFLWVDRKIMLTCWIWFLLMDQDVVFKKILTR